MYLLYILWLNSPDYTYQSSDIITARCLLSLLMMFLLLWQKLKWQKISICKCESILPFRYSIRQFLYLSFKNYCQRKFKQQKVSISHSIFSHLQNGCFFFPISTFAIVEFKFFPQSWPHQDLLSRNVLGLAMRMFLPQRWYHPICDWQMVWLYWPG